jgi:hypothetical protein
MKGKISKIFGKIESQLVRNRSLSPLEKMYERVGYMGSGFLIAAQWTISAELYIAGFILVMVQTTSRRQWNLVILNLNGLVAWLIHLLK